jgi:hypothetical protein
VQGHTIDILLDELSEHVATGPAGAMMQLTGISAAVCDLHQYDISNEDLSVSVTKIERYLGKLYWWLRNTTGADIPPLIANWYMRSTINAACVA